MNKFVIVALIAAILIGGMILVSCTENTACPGDGKCKKGSNFIGEVAELTNCYSFGSIGSTGSIGSVTESDCLPGSTKKCACR